MNQIEFYLHIKLITFYFTVVISSFYFNPFLSLLTLVSSWHQAVAEAQALEAEVATAPTAVPTVAWPGSSPSSK